MRVALLAGGLGGARLAPVLARRLGAERLAVIANVGDDLDWMGLRVCPDLDSVSYALAGLWDRERGWGRREETFHARECLKAFGSPSWFGVGDRDLALHLERTRLLGAGQSLTQVTRELAGRLGVQGAEVLPSSDAPSPTRIRLRDGRLLDFQEWYVRERAVPEVAETMFTGAPASTAALAAVTAADAVILAPSNPLTSIGAILSLGGMREAVGRARRRIAVCPVVVGLPSSSPGIDHHARARRRVLEAVGKEDRPASIAGLYAELVDWFLVDRRDGDEVDAVRQAGMEPVLADLLDEHALAEEIERILRR